MAKTRGKTPIWRCRNLTTSFESEGALEAYWEVSLDPISDEYTPREIEALFVMLSSIPKKIEDLVSTIMIERFLFVLRHMPSSQS